MARCGLGSGHPAPRPGAWLRCTGAIATGEETPTYRREDRIQHLSREAFPEEELIFNKKVIPGSTLVPDIFLKHRKVIIEVDGGQHYREVEHFHRDGSGLEGQQERDRRKHRECAAAGISVLRIVEDAADLITPGDLRSLVARVETKPDVVYVVRSGDRIVLTHEAPNG